MEINLILCPQCGHQLAQLLGEIGQRRRLKALGQTRVRKAKNALGEGMASVICPKCKTEKQVNPAHWLGDR